MGKLAEDMNRLSDEIIRFQEARKTLVDDVKHRVSEMMADFANTRSEREAFVHDLKEGVAQLLQGFGDARPEAQGFIHDLREAVSNMLAEFRDEHCERRDEVEEMRANVREMLAEFQDESVGRAGVAHLRTTVADLLGGFHQEHAERAAGVANVCMEVATDLLGARRCQAWARTGTAKFEAASRMKPVREGAKGKAAAPGAPAKGEADDLTAITGVGRKMAEHLHDAGIFTFAQLAETPADSLHGIAGKSPGARNVEEWIAEAEEFAAAKVE